jgi:hypothetical protein
MNLTITGEYDTMNAPLARMRTHCFKCHDDIEVDWHSAGFYHLVCGHVAHPVAFPPCECGHRYPDRPPAGISRRARLASNARAEELQAKVDQVRTLAIQIRDILGSGGTSDPDAYLDGVTAAELDAEEARGWQDYQGRDQR